MQLTEKFFHQYASLINRSFELSEHVPSFSEGFLTPLQKPGKPKGPIKSLRPLCLLNGARKLPFRDRLLNIQAHGKMPTKLDIAVLKSYGRNGY